MKHDSQLTIENRCQLNILVAMGLSMREIAQRMGYHRSTLYRELARNKIKKIYLPSISSTSALSGNYWCSSIRYRLPEPRLIEL